VEAVHRVRRIVTSRRGGVSQPPYQAFNLGGAVGDDPAAVTANRARLARELGLLPHRIAWMRQVHGTGVTVLTGPPNAADASAPVGPTDALVTRVGGLALAVLAADCVPVLLADRRAGVVAAVHAGRAGAAAGIVPRALAAMCRQGADPAEVEALLGPAICGACYEVPPDLQADVEARLPGSATATRAGTTGLDLRTGIAAQLAAAGVKQVVHDPRCTAEDPQLYSYRRDGVTGRQAALVWLP
jgi:purine-nucleoside/S-methyl-5'-thioadenosine phosphorylase / adenosine deaminase